MVASLRLNLASMPMSQGQYKEAADELAKVAEMNLTPYSVLGAKLRRAWLLKKFSEGKDVNAEQAASAMAESKSLVKATLADGVNAVLSESDAQSRYEIEMLILENWSNCDPHQERTAGGHSNDLRSFCALFEGMDFCQVLAGDLPDETKPGPA